MLELIPPGLAVAGAAMAAGQDIRTREISNEISYSLLVLGILFAALSGSLGSALFALALMVPFVLVLGLLGGMGAGDAKLLLGLAPCLGMPVTLLFMTLVVLIGALAAMSWLAWRAVAGGMMARQGEALMDQRLPFAPAILGALLASLAAAALGVF